ncbi:hypothetical protein [Dolichospermum flos-aquae]|uniref:Uncharacterized protein n=1 Tax=Dolichospermum flos-aquae CCAP 1403/13F TaxID=315271 RepID=A0A6H2C3X3_DOLFA|nr:hypothetical protein [Dolichospermum flos-aquae]QJB46041.1 hypothetical protein HGD76_19565 [Dolichospermum flos-aquae CCAP 1403/13F]
MLRIFSTHGLFGFLLVGLMITSCGGNTSSNTPSGGGGNTTSQTQTPSGGGGNTTSQTQTQTPPRTLTVSVPSLGTSYTVTESTTSGDINTAATEGAGECVNRFGISQRNTTCQAEVRAAASQARDFIRR